MEKDTLLQLLQKQEQRRSVFQSFGESATPVGELAKLSERAIVKPKKEIEAEEQEEEKDK